MVLTEWLNIAIKMKTEEMVDNCEDHTGDLYDELMTNLNEVRASNNDIAEKIENIFITKTRRDVLYVYQNAIWSGIEIGKKIK